ncbi:MAG: aspartate aminotransferase family protein [Sedimentisphaerales bacterium]|nr:aspartate aminotransferase family protein [Sedimentisphaerales bacterium]
MGTDTVTSNVSLNWGKVDLSKVPNVVTKPPGPKSREVHNRTSKYMRGFSGQVKLFSVAFESGKGCTLTDVDGNKYIDFSSGIYVTTLGHCHPKVSEAIQKWAGKLMNAHDFSTPVKMELMEKMAEVLPSNLKGFQLYDAGTAAVEAGLRVARAATGKHEFISCFMDFHGKTFGAVSLAQIRSTCYGPTRASGFHMVPRPDPYRPIWTKANGEIDTDAYINFFGKYIDEGTAGQACAFVLEPIQGWAGSIFPPDDFFPKLRKLCDERGLLLFADEVLTCMGRTGKFCAMEHWNTRTDITTLGKGFGNGFPVTAVCVDENIADAVENVSASSSYGGNPMACAAALTCIEVIEKENLLEHAIALGEHCLGIMEQMKERHPIIGDVRCKGALMGIELVKDKATKEPFAEAGKFVYQHAFGNGLAWIPACHILRMSPPIVMDFDTATKGLELIEEAIDAAEKNLL